MSTSTKRLLIYSSICYTLKFIIAVVYTFNFRIAVVLCLLIVYPKHKKSISEEHITIFFYKRDNISWTCLNWTYDKLDVVKQVPNKHIWGKHLISYW